MLVMYLIVVGMSFMTQGDTQDGRWKGDRSKIMENIIVVGRPGIGKSTILNYLTSRIASEAGFDFFGIEERPQVDEIFYKGTLYSEIRKEPWSNSSLKAISTTLQEGGRSKIIFIVSQKQGGVVSNDTATIKEVLSANPEIGDKYSVIVNQVDEKIYELLTKNQNKMKEFLADLFFHPGAADHVKNTSSVFFADHVKNTSSVFFLKQINELSFKENILAKDAWFPGLKEFVESKVPIIDLTPNSEIHVNANEFEKYEKQDEKKKKDLEKAKPGIWETIFTTIFPFFKS